MKHWSEKYIQIPYEKMNCAEFVEHVLRCEFGRDYSFPQSRGSIFEETHQIRENLGRYVEKTDVPSDGDLVLMHGQRLLCHIGLYAKIGPAEYVLHTEGRIRTSVMHRVKDLFQYGYTVEGFYKWRE